MPEILFYFGPFSIQKMVTENGEAFMIIILLPFRFFIGFDVGRANE